MLYKIFFSNILGFILEKVFSYIVMLNNVMLIFVYAKCTIFGYVVCIKYPVYIVMLVVAMLSVVMLTILLHSVANLIKLFTAVSHDFS